MKHYAQLTQEQRYQIDAYRKAGLNQTETAKKLRVDKSAISREIRRNRGQRGYRAQPAQKRCLARRAESHGSRIRVSDWQRVETLIRQEWSPAEIRERLAREGQRPISHEWIYQYLKRDRQDRGDPVPVATLSATTTQAPWPAGAAGTPEKQGQHRGPPGPRGTSLPDRGRGRRYPDRASAPGGPRLPRGTPFGLYPARGPATTDRPRLPGGDREPPRSVPGPGAYAHTGQWHGGSGTRTDRPVPGRRCLRCPSLPFLGAGHERKDPWADPPVLPQAPGPKHRHPQGTGSRHRAPQSPPPKATGFPNSL